jgi:hypothetical protein
MMRTTLLVLALVPWGNESVLAQAYPPPASSPPSASKGRYTCRNHRCRMAADCRELQALGLTGNGSPLPPKERPTCGARNRQGKPCAVRVEPGKRRCRFHGGLSTGPKTATGRARIAEAQRRRWNAWRGRLLGRRQMRS